MENGDKEKASRTSRVRHFRVQSRLVVIARFARGHLCPPLVLILDGKFLEFIMNHNVPHSEIVPVQSHSP